MPLVLPSTVEELNQLSQTFEMTSLKEYCFKGNVDKGFENIPTEKQYKREVSLPNGVENWNISNFDSYLNFEDNLVNNNFKAIESVEDTAFTQVVPEDGNSRLRCESFSSMASSMDDKRMVFQGFGVKAFNTICMDSGSTCISSDHSYINPADTLLKAGLEAEETYQNLDMFLQQVPEVSLSSEPIPSPLSVSGSDSCFDISSFQNNYTLPSSSCSQDSLITDYRGLKRPASTSSEEVIFGVGPTTKRLCLSPSATTTVRRKNNIASKNCRKTRKEKQKDMEVRLIDLTKENESLTINVKVLEEQVQFHKTQLYAILQRSR